METEEDAIDRVGLNTPTPIRASLGERATEGLLFARGTMENASCKLVCEGTRTSPPESSSKAPVSASKMFAAL